MAITINSSEVKRKAMIADTNTSYDTSITALISEMKGPLEYSIADEHLSNSNPNLQATLKLGILEIITGEFLEQLRREAGSVEDMSVAGISVGTNTVRGLDLIQQGATRLQPYLKTPAEIAPEPEPAPSEDILVMSTTIDKKPAYPASSEVW